MAQKPVRTGVGVSSTGLELELIQPHMAQKPVLRGELGCACVAPGLLQGQLNDSKSICYSPWLSEDDVREAGLLSGIEVSTEETRALGGPVGSTASCRDFSKGVVAEVTKGFEVISGMTSLQARHCLTTGAVQQRTNHLLRMKAQRQHPARPTEGNDPAPRPTGSRGGPSQHSAVFGGAGLSTAEVACGLRFPRVQHAHSPPLPQAASGPGSPRPIDPGPRPCDGHAATTTAALPRSTWQLELSFGSMHRAGHPSSGTRSTHPRPS